MGRVRQATAAMGNATRHDRLSTEGIKQRGLIHRSRWTQGRPTVMFAGMSFAANIPGSASTSVAAKPSAAQQSRAANVSSEKVPSPLRLTRIDPSRNMKRFYTVAVEVTLFDDVACTRTYGRIGGRGGRVMVGLYETQGEAIAALGRIVKAKLARGYRRDS